MLTFLHHTYTVMGINIHFLKLYLGHLRFVVIFAPFILHQASCQNEIAQRSESKFLFQHGQSCKHSLLLHTGPFHSAPGDLSCPIETFFFPPLQLFQIVNFLALKSIKQIHKVHKTKNKHADTRRALFALWLPAEQFPIVSAKSSEAPRSFPCQPRVELTSIY